MYNMIFFYCSFTPTKIIRLVAHTPEDIYTNYWLIFLQIPSRLNCTIITHIKCLFYITLVAY